MTKKLEPCPFCHDGGAPELWIGEYDAHVFCAKCGTHSKGSGSGHRDDMKRIAIKNWNTRYKQTCEWYFEDYHDEANNIWTTECGERFSWAEYGHPKCCPSCGADVVDD